MTTDAEQLMAAAVKAVTLKGCFSPVAVGKRIGLDKARAESAARSLSNAGVLVLGFDCAAHFTPSYLKAQSRLSPKGLKASKASKPGRKKTAAAPAA